jgi:hypothetical protein
LPVGYVLDMVLTRDSVYVLDTGTTDSLGNVHSDGGILRVPLDGDEPERLVTGRKAPMAPLLLDDDQLFWMEEGEIWSAPRDGGADPIRLVPETYAFWSQDATHIYYASFPNAAEECDVLRVAKDTGDVQLLASGLRNPQTVLVDSQAVYVFGNGFQTIPLTGGSPVAFEGPSPVGDAVLGETTIFYVIGALGGIQEQPKQGGDVTYLVSGDAFAPKGFAPYRDHVYFGGCALPSCGPPWPLMRAPRAPGDPERLGTAPDDPTQRGLGLAVGDRGFFWMDGNLLMHRDIPEYATANPAQGASGGPCFGDLGCDPGLTCIDTVCR